MAEDNNFTISKKSRIFGVSHSIQKNSNPVSFNATSSNITVNTNNNDVYNTNNTNNTNNSNDTNDTNDANDTNDTNSFTSFNDTSVSLQLLRISKSFFVVGIDCGTTYFCVYVIRDNRIYDAICVKDTSNHRTTPSAIAFNIDSDTNTMQKMYGHSAIKMIGKKGWVVIRNWKRILHTPYVYYLYNRNQK